MKNRLRLQSVVISSFLRSWINATNPVPKRCHSAHDKNKQRTRKIEDKIIHIARARSGVHLQHFHRRDAQRERRREEENASLPAEQCGQKYAHRRKRDQVACQIEHIMTFEEIEKLKSCRIRPFEGSGEDSAG